MRVLVLGAAGMLGHKLCERISRDLPCVATVRPGSTDWMIYPFLQKLRDQVFEVDALDFECVRSVVKACDPDAIINCIGIIKQRKEAGDPVLSIQVNALFPHQLAQECRASGRRLIHISTDCVFSGSRGTYREEDVPDARDLYGRSKLLGEVTSGNCLTLRTSIVGWDLLHAPGLLEWFYAKQGQTINGYRKAIFSGLSTAALADMLTTIIVEHSDLSGLYHVGADPIPKLNLLSGLRDSLNLDINIEADDHVVIDRTLDSERFREQTGYQVPDWSSMIGQLAQDRKSYDTWKKGGYATVFL